MKKFIAPLALLATAFCVSTGARGADTVYVCDPNTPSHCATPNLDGSLNVTGSFAATLSGFTPNGNVANLAVTTSSANVALPAGTVVAVLNSGATDASIKLSIGAGSAATTDFILKSGATVGLTAGSNTFINAITASSSTTLSIAGGTGLVTGYGGGGSGGSGGVVTNAGTFAVQLTGATNNINNLSGTVSLPTGASTSALQTTGNTSLGTIATNTTGAATGTNVTETHGTVAAGTAASKSELAGGVYNSSPITLTNTQQSSIQLDQNGYAKVNVAAGGAGGGAVYGPTAVGSAAANPPVLIAGTANATATGNVQVLKVDSLGLGHVSVDAAVGSAQGAAIAGITLSPVACQTLSATPTAYTTAQVNIPTCNTYGGALTQPYTLSDNLVQGTTAAMTGTTSTSLIAAPGAGLRNFITELSCVNSHATVGTFVTIQDGSGGTALKTVAAAALFGGQQVTFPAPLRQPTANTALFVADVTTGANVICSATGYKAP